MDLEFGDEAEPVNKRSFIENKTSTETRRQQNLETIDEEEEGCYIKDSLAMNHEESKQKSVVTQDADLVVYRGRHYCGNKKFVQNFQKLFKANYIPFLEHPLVHQSEIVDVETAEEMMESFVEEISNVDVELLISQDPSS